MKIKTQVKAGNGNPLPPIPSRPGVTLIRKLGIVTSGPV